MKLNRFAMVLFPALIVFSYFLLTYIPEANAQAFRANHPKTEKATTYITSFKNVNGKWIGKFDYIQWYFGKEADREFLKDCNCSKEMDHAPDGYYIRNVNPKIRTFPISKSAVYVLQTRSSTAIKWNEKVSRAQFLTFLNERNKNHYIPFHIEIKNGVVTKITEQYIP